jgi:hypothetical protein
MKSAIKNLCPLALLALLFSATAFAQNSTLSFNGGFQGNVWCYPGGECAGTGFYDGTINNTTVGPSNPSNPGYICDDYYDNITSGEVWQASGVDVATLNSNNISQTLFGSKLSTSLAMTVYAQLAYLVNQMFTIPNLTGAAQASYSEALWYLSSFYLPGKALTLSALDSAAQGFVSAAQNYVNSHGTSLSQYANLWLYTPVPVGHAGEAQEMWGLVAVAEGGAAALYLLLAAISCFGAMFFRSRNPHAPTIA